MLIPGALASAIVEHMIKSNLQTQVSPEVAIQDFANKIEECVYDAIRSATITIPPGNVQVTGTPAAQTNPLPIIINNIQ